MSSPPQAETDFLLGCEQNTSLALPQNGEERSNNDSDNSLDPSLARVFPWQPALNVMAVMYCFFYTGIVVTAVGALLEHVESYYQVRDSVASTIFPTAILGYVCAALSLPIVVSKLGWRGIAAISPAFHFAGATVISTGFPFPVLLFGHLLVGLGSGLSDAGFNAWASKLKYANVVQGFMHSSFAAGCIIGPIATLAITNHGLQWYMFYRPMILLSLIEVIVLYVAFRREDCISSPTHKNDSMVHNAAQRKVAKLVIHCCVFYFVYNGIESSFTNWIVSYMKRVREVDQTKAALASSVFWLGMTTGRACLGPLTEYLGTGLAVSVYILIAICLQTSFMLSDNLNASLSLLAGNGMFLAPMFPSAIVLLGRKLPFQETLGAVSVAASMGQVGGAIAPLIIGLMADRFGLQYLPSVTLCLIVSLLLIWIAFARSS